MGSETRNGPMSLYPGCTGPDPSQQLEFWLDTISICRFLCVTDIEFETVFWCVRYK